MGRLMLFLFVLWLVQTKIKSVSLDTLYKQRYGQFLKCNNFFIGWKIFTVVKTCLKQKHLERFTMSSIFNSLSSHWVCAEGVVSKRRAGPSGEGSSVQRRKTQRSFREATMRLTATVEEEHGQVSCCYLPRSPVAPIITQTSRLISAIKAAVQTRSPQFLGEGDPIRPISWPCLSLESTGLSDVFVCVCVDLYYRDSLGCDTSGCSFLYQ